MSYDHAEIMFVDFDKEEYRSDIGAKKLMHDTKEKILQHRWRFPSLSIHGGLCV